jgi:hypothetical protein
MTARVSLLAVTVVCATASATAAQPREPLPRAVFDVRAASVGLPTVAGWTPPVPQGTEVPSRSLGFDLGGHLHLFRSRVISLGIGAGALFARGTTTPPEATTGTPLPEVTTRLRSVSSQLSINFGHGRGWSYLSGGIGRARVESQVSRAATATAPTAVEFESVPSINYGGGARWFLNDHIAFNLDLRWHQLSSVAASASRAAAGRATLIVAGGGISIK